MSHSCIEVGVVTRADTAGNVTVRIRRAEACHTCDAKGVCQAFGGQTTDVELEVANTLDAGVGDEVGLSLLESSVIKASLALYLLPAAGLVLGAIAGAMLFDVWDRDGRTLAGAVVGLAVGYGAAWWTGSKMGKDARYRPQLTEIISRTDSHENRS